MQINTVKLSPAAKFPTYATEGSAGFDFYSAESGNLTYGSPVIFGTGLTMEIPKTHALLIFSRSGHGFKENVRLSNSVGVIDSDYRGEIKVKLAMDFPSWQNSLAVNVGDRIAQGVVIPIEHVTFIEVAKLSETDRGSGGLGSTGT